MTPHPERLIQLVGIRTPPGLFFNSTPHSPPTPIGDCNTRARAGSKYARDSRGSGRGLWCCTPGPSNVPGTRWKGSQSLLTDRRNANSTLPIQGSKPGAPTRHELTGPWATPHPPALPPPRGQKSHSPRLTFVLPPRSPASGLAPCLRMQLWPLGLVFQTPTPQFILSITSATTQVPRCAGGGPPHLPCKSGGFLQQ